MARQKSENRNKPQGRRKTVVTRSGEPPGGGTAVPVNQQVSSSSCPSVQLKTPEPQGEGITAGAVRRQRRSAPRVVLMPKVKEEYARLVTLDVGAVSPHSRRLPAEMPGR